MEQAFSGFLHKGVIVQDIRGDLMGHVISQSTWLDTLWYKTVTNSKKSPWIHRYHYPSHLTLMVFNWAGLRRACQSLAVARPRGDELIWIASSRLYCHALCGAVNHPLEGLACRYLRKSHHKNRSRVHKHTADWQGVYGAGCVDQHRVYVYVFLPTSMLASV